MSKTVSSSGNIFLQQDDFLFREVNTEVNFDFRTTLSTKTRFTLRFLKGKHKKHIFVFFLLRGGSLTLDSSKTRKKQKNQKNHFFHGF